MPPRPATAAAEATPACADFTPQQITIGTTVYETDKQAVAQLDGYFGRGGHIKPGYRLEWFIWAVESLLAAGRLRPLSA